MKTEITRQDLQELSLEFNETGVVPLCRELNFKLFQHDGTRKYRISGALEHKIPGYRGSCLSAI